VIQRLAAGEAGLVATVSRTEPGASNLWRSVDGVEWTPVPPAAFGLTGAEALPALDVISAGPGGMVLASRGPDAVVAVWRSRDGSAWSVVGSVESTAEAGMSSRSASVASGDRLVLAVEVCPEPCRTYLWASDGGAPFTRVAPGDVMYEPHVAYTGQSYVLVGLANLLGDPVVLTSPDGLAWSQRTTDLPQGECHARDLIGGPSGVLFLGDGGCTGIWLSEP
jgi:hypothetical protein